MRSDATTLAWLVLIVTQMDKNVSDDLLILI